MGSAAAAGAGSAARWRGCRGDGSLPIVSDLHYTGAKGRRYDISAIFLSAVTGNAPATGK